MSLRPYKFVVQAVVQQLDEDGNVCGESSTQPVELFGHESLKKWVRDFPKKLSEAEK